MKSKELDFKSKDDRVEMAVKKQIDKLRLFLRKMQEVSEYLCGNPRALESR